MRTLFLPLLLSLLMVPLVRAGAPAPPTVEALGLTVGQNREYSFTDKESGYWYGRTHAAGTDWFSGWNVATERIFQDYRLYVGGQPVDRAQAQVMVYPDRIVRRYDWGEECFQLFDRQPVLRIALRTKRELPVALELVGERLTPRDLNGDVLLYDLTGLPARQLGVTTVPAAPLTIQINQGKVLLQTDSTAQGFLIALDDSPLAVMDRLRLAQADAPAWSEARAARMNRLLEGNVFKSDQPQLDAAVSWNLLSLDALITRQTGPGIYAGLPWFNDYWGRDLFISLPGACLVTGQLEVAREILLSFARYQNRDEHSRDYGRVPNRLRPDDIIYNTTDGTPRFLIALWDYVRYSGDTALVRELYPAIQRAIEGPLKYRVDDQAYLTHDDADTWMDAQWQGRIPWSPRGNRANDVQALWLRQLQAGIAFARLMGNEADAERWAGVAGRLQAHVGRDFFRPDHPYMADRLQPDGTPDFTFRPNQLFALDFVPEERRAGLTRLVWEKLVYPWGVASLSPDDPNFHPWLEHPTYLHKDEAYHNGTVWLWNNGIAIDRMLAAGATAPAYSLFENMSRQSLQGAGAVGALSELNDALPPPNQTAARPAGAFDQAWSGAEYLRVWYQSFLGLQPDAPRQTLVLAPRIPEQVTTLEYQVPLFAGRLRGSYERKGTVGHYRYEPSGLSFAPTLRLKLSPFPEQAFQLQTGETLSVTATPEQAQFEVLAANGRTRVSRTVAADAAEQARAKRQEEQMRGVHFAPAVLDPALECLQPGHAAKLQRRLDQEMAGGK
ncbi:MAG: amylo-alpha-1,6-glucosidase [Opitutales bacterium]